jgi:hypothetical protein
MLLPETASKINDASGGSHSNPRRDLEPDLTWEYLPPLPAGSEIRLPPQSVAFEQARRNRGPAALRHYRELQPRYQERYDAAMNILRHRRGKILHNCITCFASTLFLQILVFKLSNLYSAEFVPPGGRHYNDPEGLVPDHNRRVRLQWHRGQPIGSWGRHFPQFIGSIVRRPDYFNISFGWRDIPFDCFERAWALIQV